MGIGREIKKHLFSLTDVGFQDNGRVHTFI